MLKYKHALVVLSAVILSAATFTDKPANAQTKLDVVAQRDQDLQRPDRRPNNTEVRNPRDRNNWNHDEPNSRVVRLGNGDIRLPNKEIVPARRLAKVGDGYFRLPNGDILLPNEEIVSSRRLVRVRDGYFRLPDGVVVQINL